MSSVVLEFKISDFLNSKHFGKFIGQEGSNIAKIERDNKVCLELCQRGEEETVVKITGQYWDVKKALIAVRCAVTSIRNNNNRYETHIPCKLVGFLIGRNGGKINEIKLTANVDVEIDRNSEKTTTKITIIGNYHRILTALRLIDDRLSNFGKEGVYDNPKTRQFLESLEELL